MIQPIRQPEQTAAVIIITPHINRLINTCLHINPQVSACYGVCVTPVGSAATNQKVANTLNWFSIICLTLITSSTQGFHLLFLFFDEVVREILLVSSMVKVRTTKTNIYLMSLIITEVWVSWHGPDKLIPVATCQPGNVCLFMVFVK